MNIELWKDFLVNYSYIDHPDHATVDITSGGSRGGNCWGDYTCQFDVSEYEMEEELIGGIEYFTKQLNLSFTKEEIQKFINKNDISNKYEDKSEGGDYYGNYTNIHIHSIYFLELLDFIEEKSLLEEDKNQYLQVYHEIVDENQKKLEEKIHLQKIANIETTLLNLDKNKDINLNNLKKEKVRLENSLKIIDKKILKFDEDLQKEKNRLNQELKKLKEFSKNNSSSKMKIK
jgi:hypothetical protein